MQLAFDEDKAAYAAAFIRVPSDIRGKLLLTSQGADAIVDF